MILYHGTSLNSALKIIDEDLEGGELTPDLTFAWSWAYIQTGGKNPVVIKYNISEKVLRKFELTPYKFEERILNDYRVWDLSSKYIIKILEEPPEIVLSWWRRMK